MNALTRRRFCLACAAAPLALTGCGGQEASADEPPAVAVGRDACARCGMIVSDERHAAGLVAADGTATVFDDAGELVAAVRDEGLGGSRAWVHDYAAGTWLDATAAVFAVGREVMTPMGTGVVAFAQRPAAEAFAADHAATVQTWPEVVETLAID